MRAYQNSTSLAQISNVLDEVYGYNQVLGHYPFVVGELGAWIGGTWGDDAAEKTWHQNVLSYLNSYGAGYAEWEMGWYAGTNGYTYLVTSHGGHTLTWGGQNLIDAIASGKS